MRAETTGVGCALSTVALVVIGNIAFWGFIIWAVIQVIGILNRAVGN